MILSTSCMLAVCKALACCSFFGISRASRSCLVDLIAHQRTCYQLLLTAVIHVSRRKTSTQHLTASTHCSTMRSILLVGALSLAAAFGPPARATTRPLVRTISRPSTSRRPGPFSPIALQVRGASLTSPSTRRDGVNYDGTGERPQEVSDDLPEDTALRVIGLPVAFALIIIIGSQVVHFK